MLGNCVERATVQWNNLGIRMSTISRISHEETMLESRFAHQIPSLRSPMFSAQPKLGKMRSVAT